MDIDQIALDTMHEIVAIVRDQKSNPTQKNARTQLSVRNAIERAMAGNSVDQSAFSAALEREQALAAHVEAIKDHAKYVGWEAPNSKLGNLLASGPEYSLASRDLANYELSAALERIVDAWMYDDTGIHDNHGHGVMLPTARYQGVNQAIIDACLKGVSLKRRDLIKQADELDEVAAQIGILKPGQVSPAGIAVSLRMRAKDKRQQAAAL